jgi:PD-(D/E)XK nuclease superfamily
MPRLHLYSHAMDAWESGLGEWLRRRSVAGASGEKTWFVTDSYQQTSWLREQALHSGLTLFGIRFMNCRALRQRLCRIAGLPTPVFGRETLRLLVDCALSHPAAGTSKPAGTFLLKALDELAASGWLDRSGDQAAFNLLGVPASARRVLARLTESDFWRPRTDRKLKRVLRQKRAVAIGIYGFDALSRYETELLLLALNLAREGRIWVHQPLTAGSPNYEWIETLEKGMRVEAEICPAGSSARPFEVFLDAWNGLSGTALAPDLLVANTWADQVQNIVEYTAGILAKGPSKIVIAVPENSLTGPAVIRELVARGVAVTDEVREQVQASPSLELAGLVADFIGEGRTIEIFVGILQRSVRDPYQFGRIRDRLFRFFDLHQTRDVARLIDLAGMPDYVRELFETLPAAPENASWNELVKFWQTVCRNVTDLSSEHAEHLWVNDLMSPQAGILWAEIGALLESLSIPPPLFFRFVRELLIRPRLPQAETVLQYANVVVTPAAKRFGCTCDFLVLADAQAEGWPASPPENPVLRDSLKESLQQDYWGFLTTSQERLLSEERYLQLIYHTHRAGALSWYRFDEKGEELVPNHLVTFCELGLKPKIYNYVPESPQPSSLKPSIQRLQDIHSSRMDPNQPFDAYFLNFEEAGLPKRPWHPSELKTVRDIPATFAFKALLRCEIQRNQSFSRNQSFVLGSVVHRLLEEAFQPTKKFVRLVDVLSLSPPTNENAVAALKARIKTAAACFAAAPDFQGDFWWRSVLKKAVWIAEQIVQNLTATLDPLKWFSSEYEMMSSDEPGRLYLRGRADLLINNRPDLSAEASVTVVDFKSSLSDSVNALISRHIFQFVAYSSLLRSVGAGQCRMELATPVEAKTIPDFRIEENEDSYQELIKTQRTLCLGRRGNARTRFENVEHLPIATLPFDQRLLEQKRARGPKAPEERRTPRRTSS